MDCDIHTMMEVKNKHGWWINAGDPEIIRCYGTFSTCAILANVRNYDEIPPVSEPKGIPDDCCTEFTSWSETYCGHSHSHITLKELKDYDKSQVVCEYCLILNEIIDKLEAIGMKNDEDIRIVFFFNG